MRNVIVLSFCFIALLIACGKKDQKNTDTLFVQLDPNETGISFENNVQDQDSFNIMSYRNFYNGGGVAVGDINNDGLPDVYFTSNMGSNKLYLNKGNFEFEDISTNSGIGGAKSWSTGVTMADINGDGLLDIYICNSGDLKGNNRENELFINNGNLTFTEKAAEYGLDENSFSTHASFFDYDLDGDLDVYLLNNSYSNIKRIEQFKIPRDERYEGGDKLLSNDNGKFVDVTEQAGIYSSWIGFGLGVSVSDINGDMLPDIYISNDFWERDYLYINKGNGTFSEEAVDRTSVASGSSMGSDVADLNNDGYDEIFTTEMLPGDNLRLKTMVKFDETDIEELKNRSSYHFQYLQNCLHFNDGTGNFQEAAFLSNVAATDWSWGALMFDMNNDGWKDIFISNGIYHDITSMDFAEFVADRENVKKIIVEKGKFELDDILSLLPSTKLSNYAFINQRNLRFGSLADSIGLGEPSFSNGAAYGDLDNDGDLDLVVNNLNMPSFVYKNTSEVKLKNNFLKVGFKGSDGNKFGIGAKVIVYHQGNQQVMQNFTSRGYQSSVEPKLHFGLGNAETIDSLVVIWPNLKTQVLKDVKVNQEQVVNQAQASAVFIENDKETQPLFKNVTEAVIKGNHTHRENEYNDFDHERLMPRKLSTEGPKIVTGDLNNDGLEDILILGAYGDPDKLFFQDRNGESFEEQIQPNIRKDSIFESTCAAMLDLNGDGFLDIIVGSGGNEYKRGADAHILRYYENDGKGNFNRIEDRLPPILGNFSVILAEDFDKDGDPDIFLGCRIVPGNYGLIPKSYLFRNDGYGKWANLTSESLQGVGMVTDAIWSDYDNDSFKDLIVVGDWMPVTIFKNLGTKLDEPIELDGTHGWWTSVKSADLNHDGGQDLVLGNWGLNTKFKASIERPITMHVKDFDQNEKGEFVINWYPPLEEKAYPFHSKADLTSQMPMIRKRAVKYEDYATKTYEDLFTAEQRGNTLDHKATFLESAILWNNCDSKFLLEPLPIEAQISPVFAIIVEDLDDDGNEDLFLAGNFYGLKPEVGRHDSSNGVYLKGDGRGKFSFISNQKTGLDMKGEVRDAKLLKTSTGKQTIVFVRNNAPSLIFQKK